MPRLTRGENQKIDHINDLVELTKNNNSSLQERQDSMEELLSMFKPLLIKLCDKWAKQFNDQNHKIIPFNDLLADAQYWFIHYTLDKYIIDGDATYNKFINDHMDQRIRYIYETNIKLYSKLVFPDPDKYQEDDEDQLEMVLYNYSSEVSDKGSLEDEVVDGIIDEDRKLLANRIMELIKGDGFTERERKILIETMYNGVTQDKISKNLGISRTRVVQILRKAKQKLKNKLLNDDKFWELINKTDIEFDNILF